MDRWQSIPISCQGGLVLDMDSLLQGTQFPGSARMLQNYEPHPSGGYRRISGYIKYDDDVVPGDTNAPVLGVKVGLSGVFATRKLTADNAIHYSNGSGWTKVSTTARPGAVTKARFTTYSLVEPVVIQCDGINPAWKWNGTVESTINGTGTPADPKYAKLFRGRLALAGHGAGDLLVLSAPNDDEDFDASNGALVFTVGDTIKGLGIFREDLVIFCESSIKKLAGATTDDFAILPITDSVGCVSHDSIQELGGDLIYLATDGFRSYAATERLSDVEISLVSRSIQPEVLKVLAKGLNEDQYSACSIRKKSQYRLFLYDTDAAEDDTLGVLGRLQDAPTVPHGQYEWATLRGIKPYCADSEYNSNLETAVIGHGTTGYVYLLEAGNTFDGRTIIAIYRTPDLTFENAVVRKVFHKIALYTQLEGDFEATVKLILDRGNPNIIQPAAKNLVQVGAVPVYGEAIYGTSVYGATIFPNFNQNLVGSGFFGAFEFTCNNDSAPFRIESFQIQFANKGIR
jgi:hypothetical protein